MDSTRQAHIATKDLSETDFDTAIRYISAGALVLSLTFIEKILPVTQLIELRYLVASWISFILTLSINLLSVCLSSYFHVRIITLSSKGYKGDLNKIIDRMNFYMHFLNFLSVLTIILGLSLMTIFCSTNLSKKINDSRNLVKPESEMKFPKVQKIADSALLKVICSVYKIKKS